MLGDKREIYPGNYLTQLKSSLFVHMPEIVRLLELRLRFANG
jgi:hypothetical protein